MTPAKQDVREAYWAGHLSQEEALVLMGHVKPRPEPRQPRRCPRPPGLRHRGKLYGVTPEEWAQLWADQDGRCAVCRAPLEDAKRVHLDHCHGTGKVRGILCTRCNVGLGMFRDNPRLLALAANYLGQES